MDTKEETRLREFALIKACEGRSTFNAGMVGGGAQKKATDVVAEAETYLAFLKGGAQASPA